MSEIILSAAQKLRDNFNKQHILVGFDGFIDEIIELVDKRPTQDTYQKVPTIADFADRIAAAAGYSTNIEMVVKEIRPGGNGPIQATTMLDAGFDVTYIGALGEEQIHPLYHQFASRCRKVYSLADPGRTEALEFNDGKIMMGKYTTMGEVSWGNLLNLVYTDKIEDILKSTSLASFNNWTMLPNMASIIEGLAQTCQNTCKNGREQGMYFFFDPADPSKRTRADILQFLSQLSELDVRVVLSLNERESYLMAQTMDIGEQNTLERAEKLRAVLNIHQVVVHSIDKACCAYKDGSDLVPGPYTPSPNLTTGAGDNFNGGYVTGLLTGLTPAECLAVAGATSGYYVRRGCSPTRANLVEFMQKWAASGADSL